MRLNELLVEVLPTGVHSGVYSHPKDRHASAWRIRTAKVLTTSSQRSTKEVALEETTCRFILVRMVCLRPRGCASKEKGTSKATPTPSANRFSNGPINVGTILGDATELRVPASPHYRRENRVRVRRKINFFQRARRSQWIWIRFRRGFSLHARIDEVIDVRIRGQKAAFCRTSRCNG